MEISQAVQREAVMKELPADLQQAVERRNELVGDVAAMHDLVEEALVVVVLLRGTGARTA